MGVQGLWDLVSPAGQRVNLSALENKVIAVDASIWLYHFLKAMRDEHGNMVKGAHLLGFFRRICKLLYLKIKPVFVFDGPPPRLKLHTLNLRAQQRASEERNRRKAVEKLLRNQIKMHVLSATMESAQEASTARESSSSLDIPRIESNAAAEEDEMAVPQSPAEDADGGVDSDRSAAPEVEEVPAASDDPPVGGQRWKRRKWRRRDGADVPLAFQGFMAKRRGVSEVVLPEMPDEPLRDILQVPDRRRGRSSRMSEPDEWKGYVVPGGGMVTIPLDGPVSLEDFQTLSPKTKYTLLQRAQEAWYGESRLKAVQAKDDMGAFVNVQLETFLRHIRTNKEIEKVKRAMAEEARPAGNGIAEGDVYTPPSWLRPASDAGPSGAASAHRAGEQCPPTGVSDVADSAAVAQPGDATSSRPPRRKGRGRGVRQLNGAEVARLRPVQSLNKALIDCLGEGEDNTQCHESAKLDVAQVSELDLGSKPMQTRNTASSVDDLFGPDFFQGDEDRVSETRKLEEDAANAPKLDPCNDPMQMKSATSSVDDLFGADFFQGDEDLGLGAGCVEEVQASDIAPSTPEAHRSMPKRDLAIGRQQSQSSSNVGMLDDDGYDNMDIRQPKRSRTEASDDEACEFSSDEASVLWCDEVSASCITPPEERPGDCHIGASNAAPKESPVRMKRPTAIATQYKAEFADPGDSQRSEPELSCAELEEARLLARESLEAVLGAGAVECGPISHDGFDAEASVGLAGCNTDDYSGMSATLSRVRHIDEAVLCSPNDIISDIPSAASSRKLARHIDDSPSSDSKRFAHAPQTEVQTTFQSQVKSELQPVRSQGQRHNACQSAGPVGQGPLLQSEEPPCDSPAGPVRPEAQLQSEQPESRSTPQLQEEDEKPQSRSTSQLQFESSPTAPKLDCSQSAANPGETSNSRSDSGSVEAAPPVPTQQARGHRQRQAGPIGSNTDSWCTQHFQYGWRCREDGLNCVAGGAAQHKSPEVTPAPKRTAAGSARSSEAARNEGLGDVDGLADEDLEDLEFQRLQAELDDERRELQGEVNRAKRNLETVTPEMQADVERLLEAFGIPFIHSPAEAEAQCVFLAEANLVDAVATDDSDALVFGACEIYRRLFSEDHMVECYTAARVEAKLGLLRNDLIALAMLLGCDYTLGVHGVGIVNGLEIVRAFAPGRRGSERVAADAEAVAWMEQLGRLQSWAQNVADWGQDSAGVDASDPKFVSDFKVAHRNFRTQWSFPTPFPHSEVFAAFVNPVVDRSLERPTWGSVDENKVLRQLVSATGVAEEKLRERLDPAIQRYKDTLRQPRITEYMVPTGVGDVAVVRSSRMRDALRGLRGETPPEEPGPERADNLDPEAKRAAKRRKQATKSGWSLRPNEGGPIVLDLDL